MITAYRGVLLYVLYTLPRSVPMRPLTEMVMLMGKAQWAVLAGGVGMMALVLWASPARAIGRRWLRLVVCLLGSVTLTAAVCMEAADAAVFINSPTASRVNWRPGELVHSYPDILKSINETYPVWSMAILVVVLFYACVRVLNYLFWLERR
jgi:hypothetical protein